MRRSWEHQFPVLTGEWTHWWITGDGTLLAIVSGSDLGALDVVDRYHDRCRWIMVYPAKVGSSGEVVRDAKREFEIEGRNKFGQGAG
jgi:hypothetical protein